MDELFTGKGELQVNMQANDLEGAPVFSQAERITHRTQKVKMKRLVKNARLVPTTRLVFVTKTVHIMLTFGEENCFIYSRLYR